MSTRKIKVVTTSGVSGVIETNVTTLGELKPLLNDRNINYSGMKLMDGATRNEFSRDEAILPTGDFKLFLFPEKTKSGSNGIARKLYQISELFAELAEEVESNGLSAVNATPIAALSSEDKADLDELNSIVNGDSPSYSSDNDWD